MQSKKETAEQRRERLRQEELKNNPTGNLNDAFNRAANGNFADFVSGLSWKTIGILILLGVFGFVIIFFIIKYL